MVMTFRAAISVFLLGCAGWLCVLSADAIQPLARYLRIDLSRDDPLQSIEFARDYVSALKARKPSPVLASFFDSVLRYPVTDLRIVSDRLEELAREHREREQLLELCTVAVQEGGGEVPLSLRLIHSHPIVGAFQELETLEVRLREQMTLLQSQSETFASSIRMPLAQQEWNVFSFAHYSDGVLKGLPLIDGIPSSVAASWRQIEEYRALSADLVQVLKVQSAKVRDSFLEQQLVLQTLLGEHAKARGHLMELCTVVQAATSLVGSEDSRRAGALSPVALGELLSELKPTGPVADFLLKVSSTETRLDPEMAAL